MKRIGRSGFSLIEITISSFLLGTLLLIVFKVYQMGAKAWLSSDTNSELLGRVQALSARIGREAERSTSSSLSIASSTGVPVLKGCGFLSAVDAVGDFQYEPGTTSPKWGFAEVFYFDRSQQRVFSVRHPLLGATRREVLQDYADRFIKEPPPSTRNPLPDRFVAGQPIANDIKDIQFRMAERAIVNTGVSTADATQELGQLELTISVEKKSYGSPTPLSLTSKSYYFFRN